ncbi:hypothetical protein ACQ4PT_056602 [Festuca glaucescens]
MGGGRARAGGGRAHAGWRERSPDPERDGGDHVRLLVVGGGSPVVREKAVARVREVGKEMVLGNLEDVFKAETLFALSRMASKSIVLFGDQKYFLSSCCVVSTVFGTLLHLIDDEGFPLECKSNALRILQKMLCVKAPTIRHINASELSKLALAAERSKEVETRQTNMSELEKYRTLLSLMLKLISGYPSAASVALDEVRCLIKELARISASHYSVAASCVESFVAQEQFRASDDTTEPAAASIKASHMETDTDKKPCSGVELFIFDSNPANRDGVSISPGSQLSLTLCLLWKRMLERTHIRIAKLYCILATSPSLHLHTAGTRSRQFEMSRTAEMVVLNPRLLRQIKRDPRRTCEDKSSCPETDLVTAFRVSHRMAAGRDSRTARWTSPCFLLVRIRVLDQISSKYALSTSIVVACDVEFSMVARSCRTWI